MSVWAAARLVAVREADDRLRSRAFLIGTLVFLLVVGLSVALPALLDDGEPEAYDVVVLDDGARALVDAVPAAEVDLTPVPTGSASAGERLLRAEDADALLEAGPQGLRVTGLQEVPEDLLRALGTAAQEQQLVGALTGGGRTEVAARALLAGPPVATRLLDDPGVDPGALTALPVAFGMLTFFLVFQFGFAIAQSVVQEKESRVVELLVAAVPVRALLLGKVLGNGALALGQLVLILLTGLAAAAAVGEAGVLGLLARNSPWFVLFFTLGFGVLACLWAAAGALAGRTEDLQSTTAPMQVLVLGPLFAAFYVTDGPAQVVLSFTPFTSPLVMPARLLTGDAGLGEALLSAFVLVLTGAGAVLVGDRLYRASLLRTRGTTGLREAWRSRVTQA